MAIDVGTTTCAGYLCDLTTMAVIGTSSIMNPQCKYGEDVMARITFHMNTPGGLKRMSDDIIEGINFLIDKAIAEAHTKNKKNRKKKGGKDPEQYREIIKEGVECLRISKEDIEDVTLCFNTAMHHIFLGLDPEPLGLAPFPPVIHHSLDIKARDLNIDINPSSYIFAMPNEAGFVGGDNVGVLLAEEPYKGNEIQLIIDIGTNGELILGNRHQLFSSSCATGAGHGRRSNQFRHAGHYRRY